MSGEQDTSTQLATFAGGCFWCMVKPFHQWPGVIRVTSGYTGGNTVNPTYEEVCTGTTGHVEAVEIEFQPSVISYDTILDVFWKQIDPTDDGGQFCDRGSSYRTAIFYHTEEQKQTAEASKSRLAASGIFTRPIVTPILPATAFYPAESYHQDFYQKNKAHYERYRNASGRDEFIRRHWSNP